MMSNCKLYYTLLASAKKKKKRFLVCSKMTHFFALKCYTTLDAFLEAALDGRLV